MSRFSDCVPIYCIDWERKVSEINIKLLHSESTISKYHSQIELVINEIANSIYYSITFTTAIYTVVLYRYMRRQNSTYSIVLYKGCWRFKKVKRFLHTNRDTFYTGFFFCYKKRKIWRIGRVHYASFSDSSHHNHQDGVYTSSSSNSNRGLGW